MGTGEISISGAYALGDYVYVSGTGFTEWSTVCIDGEEMETVYVDKTALKVEDVKLESGSLITVSQIGKDGEILSRTEEYVCTQN